MIYNVIDDAANNDDDDEDDYDNENTWYKNDNDN